MNTMTTQATTLRRIITISIICIVLTQIDGSYGFERPSPEQHEQRRAEIRAIRRASLRHRSFDLGPSRKNCGGRCHSGDDEYLDWLLAKKPFVDNDMTHGFFPLRMKQRLETLSQERQQREEL